MIHRPWQGRLKVLPAIVNNTLASLFVKVGANSGDAPVPQSATILGGFGVASGDYLRPYTDDRPGGAPLALYFGMPAFAGTGPRHLVLNYGNDIYVLPQAVNLVKRPAPVIASVRPNADGSVTVTGSNFGARQRGLLRRHTGSEAERVQRQRRARLPDRAAAGRHRRPGVAGHRV